MGYGIIRAEKVKMTKVNSNLQKHHQREKDKYYSNPDIDPTRAKDNVCLVHCDNFREEINKKIKEYNIKKVRSDAVGMIDIISTCSSDFFTDKSREWIIKYFEWQMPLIQREFGPLISANIHFDEKNVHCHFSTVPIIQNKNGTYSLSAKRIMGNQKDYIARQDRFYELVFSRFGLERGVSKKESQREHLDTIRFKTKMEQDELKIIQNERINAIADKEIINFDIADLKQQIKILQSKVKQHTTEADKIKQQTQSEIDNLMQIKATATELQNFLSCDNYLQEVAKKVNNSLLRNGEIPDTLKNKHVQYWEQELKPVFDDMQSVINEVDSRLHIEYDSIDELEM